MPPDALNPNAAASPPAMPLPQSRARRKRFPLVLGLLGVLVAGMVAFLVLDLHRVKQEVRGMYAGSIQGLDALGELQFQTQESRRCLLYALATTDSNLQVRYADQSRAAGDQATTGIQAAFEQARHTAEITTAQNIKQDWAGYLQVRDELIASMLDGNPKEAIQRDLRDGIPAFARVRDDLETISDALKKDAARQVAEVDTMFTRSMFKLGIVLTLTVLAALVTVRRVQRHELQQVLQSSEADQRRLVAIIEATPDFVGIADAQGRPLYLNRAARQLLGLGADAALPRTTLADFYSDTSRNQIRDFALAAAARDGFWRGELTLVTPAGIEIAVAQTFLAHKTPAGELEYFSTIARDITEQKRAEAVQQRLVNYLEASSNEVYVFDPVSLRFSYVNQSALGNLGYTPEAMRRLTPVDLKPEFTEAQFRSLVAPLLDGTTPRHYFQTIHRRADGTDYAVEVYLQVVSGAGEKVFLAVINDITARKQTEVELITAQQRLLESSRLAGMAEMATGVLHNVGNVLNSVNVAANCLADGVRKSKAPNLARVASLFRTHEADLGAFLTHDEKGRQVPGYLAQLAEHLKVEQSGARQGLVELQLHIDHIKDIVAAQQSLAKLSGVTEVLEAPELVAAALRLNEGSLASHGVEVVKEFEPGPSLTVDKHKALQILVNLMQNAKQACNAGPAAEKRMTLRVRHGDGRVRISVTDNGVGIPRENLDRIFNHGFTTKKTGHGFGLHSAANAATEMGGSLSGQSEGAGHGATFTLELPHTLERHPPVKPASNLSDVNAVGVSALPDSVGNTNP